MEVAEHDAVNLIRVLERCAALADGIETLPPGQLARLSRLQRHIETEQARLAESGAVSCDALNALSARYQKVASAVRAFERAQAQRRKDEAAAAAAAAAVAAAAVTASATADTVTTPARRDEPRTGAGGGVRQRSKRPTTGSDARAELLGTDGRDGDGEASEAGHSKLQEALAADMLQMTKTLKDIMKETGRTLEADDDVIASATAGADRSIKKQATANDMLAEQIKRSGGCWMWLMLLSVGTSFLGMVVFMRIF